MRISGEVCQKMVTYVRFVLPLTDGSRVQAPIPNESAHSSLKMKPRLPAKTDRQWLRHPHMIMRLPSDMQHLLVILHLIFLQAAGGFVVQKQ